MMELPRDRFANLLRAALRALEALVAVGAPFGRRARDCTSQVTFGPFSPGDLVRITTSANAWFRFDAEGATISGDGDGIPIAGWDRQDYEITDSETFVHILADSNETVGSADVFVTGRRNPR